MSANHFRVIVMVQEVDDDGFVHENHEDVIIGDFPNDSDDSNVGQCADDYLHTVVLHTRELRRQFEERNKNGYGDKQ